MTTEKIILKKTVSSYIRKYSKMDYDGTDSDHRESDSHPKIYD